MTVPLGNTPAAQNITPDELKSPGLIYMGDSVKRGEPPVIVFYRTVSFPAQFAPKPQNIDPATGRPKLVDPVEVDLYFPNGPLQGRVYRKIQFIGAGITRPIRATAIGSINVGQLATGQGTNGDYPQLNSLDSDALDWASKIHQAAGGDVFAYYSGQPSEPVQTQAAAPPQPQPPADRFANAPLPEPGSATAAPSGPPPGMPGAGGPPPGFPPAGGQQQAQPNGQPGPTSAAPPAGIPGLGGPPPGMPGAQGAGVGAPPV